MAFHVNRKTRNVLYHQNKTLQHPNHDSFRTTQHMKSLKTSSSAPEGTCKAHARPGEWLQDAWSVACSSVFTCERVRTCPPSMPNTYVSALECNLSRRQPLQLSRSITAFFSTSRKVPLTTKLPLIFITFTWTPSTITRLSRLGGNLGWGTLGLHLRDFGSLTLCCLGSTLGLLGLPLALSGGLLLLAFLDSSLSGGGSGFWSHGSSLLDDVEGCTNDGSLVLDRSAGSLLGDFLSGSLVPAQTTIYAHRNAASGFVLGVTAIPLRYPFGVVFGRVWSMLFFGGSFAEGREIRSFHSGIGRSCCHLGRRACPVRSLHRQHLFLKSFTAIICPNPAPL